MHFFLFNFALACHTIIYHRILFDPNNGMNYKCNFFFRFLPISINAREFDSPQSLTGVNNEIRTQ